MFRLRLLNRAICALSLGVGLMLTACPAEDDNTNASASSSSNDEDDEDDESGDETGSETSGVSIGSESDSEESDSAESDSEESDSEESDSEESDSEESESESDSDTESDSDSETQAETVDFILPADGGPINECDIWAQDCPEGNKCMPWANDGGNSWNATKCSPVGPDPGVPGDSCTVEGSGVSGVDSCALSAMCWDVDGKTNTGVCVGFCEGSEANAVCSDPDEGCSITNEGVLILCLARCDPLLQDCPEGNACYDEPNGFFCSPDASGADQGVFGDPCEFLNACDPGLFCAAAETVPGCAGSAGCCSDYCDYTDPEVSCQGAGQECTPFYEPGSAPPGYEDVGVCIIPQ